jgi:hypothetical protein
MPQFKKTKAFTRNVSVDLTDGDKLCVTYAPARVSEQEWSVYTSDANSLGSTFLSKILVAWDWTDEKEKPIPITAQFLKEEVGVPDLVRIAKAIIQDVFPPPNPVTNANSSSL